MIHPILRWFYPLRALPLWVRGGAAVIGVAIGWGLREMIGSASGQHVGFPFVTFLPIIIFAGLFVGRGTALLALLLSSFAGLQFMSIEKTGWWVPLLVFIATIVVILGVIEALHLALRDLRDTNEALRDAHRRTTEAEQSKELLLREFGHRVQNDFASLTAILRIEGRRTTESNRLVLQSISDRITIIAKVHAMLSQRHSSIALDTSEFVSDLCSGINSSLLHDLRPVKLVCDAGSYDIDMDRAVPLGLIINELITNALKYAFPDGREGVVDIRFRREGNQYRLSVRDNGVGLDGKIKGTGLGHRLTEALAAQLGGSLAVGPSPNGVGVVSTVLFPVEKKEAPARAAGAPKSGEGSERRSPAVINQSSP